MTHLHQDSDGKVIASGGAVVRKESSYSEYREVQLTVNQTNGVVFNNTSRILKFELRRSPRNERIEDVILEWEETNPSAVPVVKLPSFWNCIDSIRVLLNNKEVVDWKSIHGIKNEWRDRLFTSFKNERDRDYNLAYKADAGGLQTPAGLIQAITIPAGESRTMYASFNDILPGVFHNLSWKNLFLLEFELTFTNQQNLIGDVPEVLQVTHNNILCYARTKALNLHVQKAFSNHTLYHNEHEVLRFPDGPLHVGGTGVLQVDLHTFIPRRTNIQRIIVYSQPDATFPDAYREFGNRFIGSLLLERNGDDFQATRWFYENRRQIQNNVQKYYRRTHGGVTGVIANVDTVGYGVAFPEIFIDCSTLSKTANVTPILETKTVCSDGIDNHSNLNLIITCDAALRVPVGWEVIVVVEWQRFDRINPAGNVIRISTP